MKILLVLTTISCIFTSCCKVPMPVAAISINYPDISNSKILKAVRTDRNNFSDIIDTISLGELHSYNNYTATIEFEDNPLNYIISVEDTHYTDTISEIMFERDSKNKIRNFEYRFNGQKRTDVRLTIK
ncbi:MAG: hypothetical protein LBV26_05650 [Bacteroidales bacterium]|nr:hypothetical protein [Bacteroidales bacterium]